MATWQHLRSSTANKRPTTSLADGRIAINTNTASPGLFFKDSAGTGLVKVGPVHVGTTAPNSVPAAGGSSGNYTGEQWLDTSVSPAQMKVWNGSTWVGIVADELPVSKLQDGAARQLIQTDAAGTGVEWTSNIDVPGTLDVTSTATFDSIAQYPAGSAAVPTITFTGDTNTGIYSPGADQLAISTGGSGRLFVDASGNVGVGTATTNWSLLDGLIVQTGNGYAGINIASSSATDNAYLAFGYGTTAAEQFSASVGRVGNNTLVFGTNNTERLRITSAGLVGVGVSSVGAQLEVQRTSATDPALRLRYNSTSYYADHLMDGNGNYIIYSPAANGVTSGNLRLRAGTSFAVSTNDQPATSPALFIDASQRVGIGTSSPGRRLVVAGDTNTVCAVQGANNGTSSIFLGDTDDESIGAFTYNHVSNYLEVKVNGAERVRVDSSGRVGIGTASPGSLLDVAGEIRIYPASGDANLRFGSGGVEKGRIAVNSSSNCIIETAGTERARISSSGQLLVGTSTARANFDNSTVSARLQVEGVGNNNSTISAIGVGSNFYDSGYLLLGRSGGTSVGGNVLVANDDVLGAVRFMGNDGAEFVEGASITARVDGTPGANDLPSRLVFSTTADGASSPTERMRITSAGSILSFAASANDAITAGVASGAGATPYLFAGVHSRTGTATGGTLSYSVAANGNVQNTNGSYTTISDAKLKENIVDAGSQWDDLKAIQIRNWNFKAETGHETHRQIGPIAQELETVCPGLVFETPDRDEDGNETSEVTKGVNQSVLYMKAVKALQEAMDRIEQLEQRLTDAGIA